jgi:hypothetical protein
MRLPKLLLAIDLIIVSAVIGAYSMMTFAASTGQAMGGLH